MSTLSTISDAQRRSLAKRHLSGSLLVDLVGFADLTLEQLRALFSQDRMKRILEEEQAYIDAGAIRARTRMSYGVEESVDRMKARGAGVDGPQIAFQADKFIIESILPRREHHIVEQNTHHTLDAKVAVQLSDALDTVKQIFSGGKTRGNGQPLSKYVLRGLEGIPIAESSEATQELVVEGPSVSGSPTPDPGGGGESGQPDAQPDS